TARGRRADRGGPRERRSARRLPRRRRRRGAAVTRAAALFRKELASLFGTPTAYLALTMVALVTALIFFDHLRLYNQILFLYATSTVGGFDADAIPDHVNLWNNVFAPVMENLGLGLMAAVPLVTMRAFAEERARGTDELLLAAGIAPGQIVVGK